MGLVHSRLCILDHLIDPSFLHLDITPLPFRRQALYPLERRECGGEFSPEFGLDGFPGGLKESISSARHGELNIVRHIRIVHPLGGMQAASRR
jgi:hypothetical protein